MKTTDELDELKTLAYTVLDHMENAVCHSKLNDLAPHLDNDIEAQHQYNLAVKNLQELNRRVFPNFPELGTIEPKQGADLSLHTMD